MKKTKKLMAGCEVLEAENYCDCGPGEVFRAVLGGTVAGQQVYNALKYFGYRWNVERQEWRMVYPKWILNFHKIDK